MPESDSFIQIRNVGQFIPLAPSGAVVIYDRGEEYGTDYNIDCISGSVRYTQGEKDGFRYIISQAAVFGGGAAPAVRQDNAVWGPKESFSETVQLSGDIGQGERNSALLTGSPVFGTNGYCDEEFTVGSSIYRTVWYYLHEFNKQWNVFKDWFVPSTDELDTIVGLTANGGPLFGFLKYGWIQGSNEASTDTAVSGLITEGSSSSTDKLQTAYGRLFLKYIGGEGWSGPNDTLPLPSGTTGSFPPGYDLIRFRRLQNQSSGETHRWGFPESDQIDFSSQLVAFRSGATGTAVGEGIYLSQLIRLGAGLKITDSALQTTDYWGENLFLFTMKISLQTNSYSVERYWETGTEGGMSSLETIPFVPSRDELMLVLNSARGKGYFVEGEEFWSSSDSGSQAYAVTYHDSSEPTTVLKSKTESLKVLVCRFYSSGSMPVVGDPVIEITDV